MVSCPLLFPSVNTGIPLAVGTAFLRRQTAAFPPVNTGTPSPPKAALVIPDKWQHPFF